MKTALIICDMQNDYFKDGAIPNTGAEEILPIVNTLHNHFDVVVITQDQHPPNHASFAKVHDKQPGDYVELHGDMCRLWDDHCVEGTRGANLHPDLELHKTKMFPKGTDLDSDTCSAFWNNGGSTPTGLLDYLRENDITDVFICGMSFEFCVNHTAIDALDNKFRVWIINDACAYILPAEGITENADDILVDLIQQGVSVVQSDHIKEIFAARETVY